MTDKEPDVPDDRFTRIEEKLDKVEQALVTLARMDERLISLFKHTEKQTDELKSLTARVAALEKQLVSTGVWGYIGDKILWVVFGAVVMLATKFGLGSDK